MPSDTVGARRTAASPPLHVIALAAAFTLILVASLLYPVSAFKASVALLVPLLIWRDRLNAYLCVLLIPFLSTALFLIAPKAGFPYDPYFFGIWFVFIVARSLAERRIPRLDVVDILVFVYVAIGVVYLLVRSDPALGYQGFKYDHRPLLVYLLLRASGSAERDWKRVAGFLVVVMLLVLADAFYRYAFDYMSVFQFQVKRSANLPDVVTRVASYYGLGSLRYARLASVWMFAAALGPMLMVTGLLLVGLRRFVIDKVGTPVFVALFGVVFVGLLLTYSRSGWIGLVLGAAVIVLLEDKEARARLAKAAVLFSALALAGLLAASTLSTQVLSRIGQLWTLEFGSGGHVYFLALSVAAIATNPLGTGLGTGFSTQIGSSADVVWNESTYFRVGMEKGIVPMVLLVVILLLMARRIYGHFKASHGSQRTFYQTAFAIGIVILLINITFPYWESLMTHLFMFAAASAINMRVRPTDLLQPQASTNSIASHSG